MLILPTITIPGPALVAVGGGGDPDPETLIDYVLVSSQNSVDPHTVSLTGLPDPVAGQRLYLLLISDQQGPTTPSIGGSTSGVTRVDQVAIGSEWAAVYEKTGWESTSLDVTIDYTASSSFSVMHGWRTLGWDFLADSLLASIVAASNTTSVNLAVTKAAGDITCIGTRRYTTIEATPAPSVDFTGPTVAAARLMGASSFSGNVLCSTGSAATNKVGAAFNLTPEV